MSTGVLVPDRQAASGVAVAAARPIADVFNDLTVVDGHGLTVADAATRLVASGPNAPVADRTRAWSVLWHQLRSPLLGLLVVAAAASYAVGERSGAVIIVVIVALSVGLGFVNEVRAEKAAEALHSGIHHQATVRRDGVSSRVDVTTVVPADRVRVDGHDRACGQRPRVDRPPDRGSARFKRFLVRVMTAATRRRQHPSQVPHQTRGTP